MSTIKEHYERLHQEDPDKWGEFNGRLSSRMAPKGDCLTYFKRSVIDKEERGGKVDLSVTYYWIVKLIVEYLGFTWHDIETNKRPTLPTVQPVEL